ncbi:hypothetical protein [Novosphingobium sp. Leaf2]|uniref:hypothetical protein n=1 Tax=Novosphingobium sp. Leaf2 TaxID=1735670 RepID=UPI0006F53196|nr:hypothetical protein [Novosphingobium sp. Leaf2]KQM21345.1 hypothetical protein ASE49_14775 [Novosphingobium sp. Leaf2]
MRIFKLSIAAALLAGSLGMTTAATAQPYGDHRMERRAERRAEIRHEIRRDERRHDRRRWARRHNRCETIWRHHRRVRVCR